MKKDLKVIAIAYTFIVLIFWIVTLSYTHNKEVKKLNSEIAELNKTVKELREYVDVLEQSREQLNYELEDRELYIIELERDSKLLKDLRSSR